MWYKYIIPRKVAFLNATPYRWFNFILFPYPRKLEWKRERTGLQNFYANLPMGEVHQQYLIGPSEHDSRIWCYVGPNLKLGYRASMDEAAKVCEQHYVRHVLKLNGLHH